MNKKIIWIHNMIVLTSLLLIIVALFLKCTQEQVFCVAIVCVIIYATFLAFLLLEYLICSKTIKFSKTEIQLCFFQWIYKRIPYHDIKGILIKGAVDCYFFPIVDNQKKQVAVMSFYNSEIPYKQNLCSSSWISIPCPAEYNNLCYDIFDVRNINVLMDNTQLDIYITKEILCIHKDYIIYNLMKWGNRVYVIVNPKNEAFSCIALNDFLNSKETFLLN